VSTSLICCLTAFTPAIKPFVFYFWQVLFPWAFTFTNTMPWYAELFLSFRVLHCGNIVVLTPFLLSCPVTRVWHLSLVHWRVFNLLMAFNCIPSHWNSLIFWWALSSYVLLLSVYPGVGGSSFTTVVGANLPLLLFYSLPSSAALGSFPCGIIYWWVAQLSNALRVDFASIRDQIQLAGFPLPDMYACFCPVFTGKWCYSVSCLGIFVALVLPQWYCWSCFRLILLSSLHAMPPGRDFVPLCVSAQPCLGRFLLHRHLVL